MSNELGCETFYFVVDNLEAVVDRLAVTAMAGRRHRVSTRTSGACLRARPDGSRGLAQRIDLTALAEAQGRRCGVMTARAGEVSSCQCPEHQGPQRKSASACGGSQDQDLVVATVQRMPIVMQTDAIS